MATAGGAVLLVRRYDGFGVTVAQAGPLAGVSPVGYRGERYDPTLGQYYLRARFYDPRSGRFTAQDPLAGTYADPVQSMRFGYTHHDPINFADPTGLVEGGLSGLPARIGAGLGLAGRIGAGVGRVAHRVLLPFRHIRGLQWAARYNRLNLILARGTQTLSSGLQLLTLGFALGLVDRAISAFVGIPIDGSDLSGSSPVDTANGTKLPPAGVGTFAQVDGQWVLPGTWLMSIRRRAGHSWVQFTNAGNPAEVHTFSRWLQGAGNAPVSGVIINLPTDVSNRDSYMYSRTTTVTDPVIMGGDGYDWNITHPGSCDSYSARSWNLNVTWAREETSLETPIFSALLGYPLTLLMRPFD